MIIVSGHLVARPGQRDRVVELSREAVTEARATPGCLDFAVCADSVDPNRVNVVERWGDRGSLERFRGQGPGSDLSALLTTMAVTEYAVEAH